MSITSEISRLNTAKADIKTALEGKGIPVSSTLKIDGYAELIDLGLIPDTRVAVKYNVTDTSNPTALCNSDNVSQFSEIEIDGVVQPSVVSSYTFPTSGIHTVRFTLADTTSIGLGTFYNCSSLTSISIPNSVTSIGDYAFRDCSSLTSVTIPNSVTSIGAGAFDATPWYNNLPDGLNYIGKVAYKYKGTMPGNTSINIAVGTVSIGSQAFRSCNGLTSITIPNSVTSIGDLAFQGCNGLTSVHITDIAAWCNISFGNEYSSPLSYALHLYMNGSEITDLVIPNSVTSIGNYAFRGCIGLISVSIPNSVTSIGSQAFYGCFYLASVNIPNSVTSIGSSVFYGCSGLTSITIPSSVTSIGSSVFQGCSGLTSITIPSSVTSIGSSAFRGCSGLTSITSLATTAPTIKSNTFRSIKIGGTLYVPSGSTGYDTWMREINYYLGKYNWTKVEQ